MQECNKLISIQPSFNLEKNVTTNHKHTQANSKLSNILSLRITLISWKIIEIDHNYDIQLEFRFGIHKIIKHRLSRYYFRFATKNISKGRNFLIVQETIERKSSKSRALQIVCICSTLIMIFFELIPSTNRGGLLAELHRFQSIQLRAGIALTFWNLERWLSKTILVLCYIPIIKAQKL